MPDSTAPAWAPSPDDVATKMARYLPDMHGSVDGGFTDSDSPTVDQVQDLIDSAATAIAAAGGPAITEALQPVARDAVAYRVAARVVASYFPESNLDFAKQLEAWGDQWLRLLGVNLDGTTGGSDVADILPVAPVGDYPQPACEPPVW